MTSLNVLDEFMSRRHWAAVRESSFGSVTDVF